MSYALSPTGSGLIMPLDLARTEMSARFDSIFGVGNHGAYRAASRNNKNTIGWKTTEGSADADTLADLPTLRNQSRDLMRNDALAAGAIATMVVGVVGQGVIPQSRIDHEFLGITEKEATKWMRKAERIFNHVAGKPTFDSEGRNNFWQQQRLVLRSKLESGDAWALRRYIKRPGKALGICVQLIEADRICTPLDKLANENIRSGIEADGDGFPIAYHVAQQHPGELFTADTKYTRILANDTSGNPLMLPVITRLRPGQSRGVPFLAPVVELFKQLGRYTDAEVNAAVISGMFAVFVKSPNAGTPGSPLAGGMIPGQVLGQNLAPTGNGITKLQSGMIVDLAPGEEIETADATRPNTAFEPFVNAILAHAGAALGIPRDVLAKSYNASYSAARAALQDAYRTFVIERDDLNFMFNQPVWEWVITEAIATGKLAAPGFFDDPMIRDAWLGTTWIGPAMASLDPSKDAKAAQAWHDLGVKSKQDICIEQGTDYDSTLQQRSKEQGLEKEAGLWVDPNPPALAAPSPAPANDNKPKPEPKK